MTDDYSTYPSRSFIRFTARNQLLADLTGEKITTAVQRLGQTTDTNVIYPSDRPRSDVEDNEPFLMNPEALEMIGQMHVRAASAQDASDPDSAANHPSSSNATHSFLNESLLDEVATTLFNVERHPELYKSCGSKQAAQAVEAAIAADIVNTYKRIQLRQQLPLVQQLNRLL